MKRKMTICLFFFMTMIQLHAENDKRIYTTQKITTTPPVIDGLFDDPAWDSVPWDNHFVQHEPKNGDAPSQKTEFKFLYDDANIYVALRAHDEHPDSIVTRMTRRDEADADILAIQLDSYLDHITCFTFMVTAGGVKVDGITTNDGENEDYSWDPVWYAQTAVDDKGWSAEMKIPLSQLRFGKKQEHIWGLLVGRILYRKEELDLSQHIPKDAPGWVHLFGELHGISGIEPPKRIELLPYAVGSLESMEKEEGNPFVTGRKSTCDFGLDGKIGLTSDLTMDFTINPDFGQVEADPSVVNLTAFETFFEEKRPFFIEGKNILDYRFTPGDGDMSNDNLFYSRRIGKPPSHEPDLEDDEYMDTSTFTPILGAMKVTGKSKNGFSIGIMDAVTQRITAEIDRDGDRKNEAVEPLTNYFMGRLQKDFNKGSTILGGAITHTYRDIRDSHLEFLNRNAITSGIDFHHEWKDRTYYLDFNTVFSHINGSEEAILEAQTASARYFQRPDADYIKLDSTRTSLSGYGGNLSFGRSGNSHINFLSCLTWRSPGLELNDMGYLREADRILEFIWLQYREWRPKGIFRSYNINFNQWSGWDFGGYNIFDGGNVNFSAQLTNYWGFGGGIGRDNEGLSHNTLRGGPSMIYPANWFGWFYMNTDLKKKIRFEFEGFMNAPDDDYSKNYSIETSIAWRPNNSMLLTAEPFLEINKNNLQYVETVEADDTDKYIFGRIDQKTVGLVLRLDYSITPNLTIQYFGQPFVSAGSYSRYKEITDPRAKKYANRFREFTGNEIRYIEADDTYGIDSDNDTVDDYTFDDPDFNYRQFLSNLVIRWEYRPGSTIYLVWSQTRTDDIGEGRFSFNNDMRDLFRVYPHNVFLIKMNYWFTL